MENYDKIITDIDGEINALNALSASSFKNNEILSNSIAFHERKLLEAIKRSSENGRSQTYIPFGANVPKDHQRAIFESIKLKYSRKGFKVKRTTLSDYSYTRGIKISWDKYYNCNKFINKFKHIMKNLFPEDTKQ